ncbi:phosphotransferase enzyme family protein [Bradyrhizobium japonicum]|uniref:phosphotransferase enzyme family protein n=1 Tax=Bradyrhizobium japonicum TaxID=375 RepID=UPI00200F03E4|nr:phosphotransferase [Bradyrhizobium japonicum]UQE03616.1 phosphotransferase [Bradyrhizobium japonicum]
MSPFAVLVARWFGVAPGAVRMITDGVNKTLRVVSDQDDVFVRFSPTSLHSHEALISEAALIATLREQDIPCCELVAIDGCSVQGPHIVNGIEYNVLLTQTITGCALAPTAHDARAFGHSLARLHRAPIKGLTRTLTINDGGEIDPIIRPVFEELTGLVQQLSDTPSASGGICHGDAWLGNAINRDGTAVLFDFEFSGHGPLAYDIATFIWALRAEGNEAEALIYARFVEGYRGEYDSPLSEHDLRVNLLRKEINNIRFLCQNITMSREVKVATARFARDTRDFALGSGLSRFAWT